MAEHASEFWGVPSLLMLHHDYAVTIDMLVFHLANQNSYCLSLLNKSRQEQQMYTNVPPGINQLETTFPNVTGVNQPIRIVTLRIIIIHRRR